MASFWLTYKPHGTSALRGWPKEEMTKLVRAFDDAPETATTLWRIANREAAIIGDRFYLFKQGSGSKGVFGLGEIIENPRLQADPDDIEGGLKLRAKIRFHRLVDPEREFLLEFSSIEDVVPGSFITARASGYTLPEDVASKLEKLLQPIQLDANLADDPNFDQDSVLDERERAVRAIRVRRGQPAFRSALLTAYAGRCAITGCAVKAVLEAAHIHPYRGRRTNEISNGLLLRTDLHTLFDCGLLAIEPTTRTVVVAVTLKSSTYAKLAGLPLRPPKDPRNGPTKRILQSRFDEFERIAKDEL